MGLRESISDFSPRRKRGEALPHTRDEVNAFNHRHRKVLGRYGLSLVSAEVETVSERVNNRANLGIFHSRRFREGTMLSAGLSAVGVALVGRGSLNGYPKKEHTKMQDLLKRRNDRTAAQIMGETIQLTTEAFHPGEEVVIEAQVTEGERAKLGEKGGNPTIPVGQLFGKDEHRFLYYLNKNKIPKSVTLLSLGSDVIDGTSKSIKALPSSITAVFITESGIKRQLPDIYVQRWASAVPFGELDDPTSLANMTIAGMIRDALGMKDYSQLSTFFLDRKRHEPMMEELNEAGAFITYDKDGDLFPKVIMGMDDLLYPNGLHLHSMIGEIGGSAEWAVGVLPLVWRGGQAIGAFTSQNMLSRKDLEPADLYRKRFQFTENEWSLLRSARFETKPYFTIEDVVEEPFAGGIAAFGGITDNLHFPGLQGVNIDDKKGELEVYVLTVECTGITKIWTMVFSCAGSIDQLKDRMMPYISLFRQLDKKDMRKTINDLLQVEERRAELRIAFYNDFYPFTRLLGGDRFEIFKETFMSLVENGTHMEKDVEIVETIRHMAPEWFRS